MQLHNKLVVLSTSRAVREYNHSFAAMNMILPKVVTIGEFFNAIVYSDKKFASDDIRVFYLRESLLDIHYKQLGIQNNYNSFVRQSDYLFKFFEELANEYVDLTTLHTHDTYALYEDHLNLLHSILTTYLDLLQTNGYTDKIALPHDYKINTAYLKQFHLIEITLDSYLTKFEYTILEKISNICTTHISLITSKYNEKNLLKFNNLLPNYEHNHHYTLNLSNSKVISAIAIPPANPNVEFYSFKARYQQIEFINYAIAQMIQANIDTKKICVILPDESFATDLLLYDKNKNLNFAMGISITQSHFFQKLQAFFEALVELEPKTQKKLEYFHIPIELFELFNARKYSPIDTHAISLLKEFIQIGLKDEVMQQIQIQFYFLQNIIKMGIQFSFIEFIKILLEKLSHITLDYVGGGEVTVMGILETRGVCFDGVIVVDFNEKYLPKTSIKDRYISTAIKQYASLPTISDRKNLQKYYYDRVFQGAKKICISYTDNDQDSISIFALELFGKRKLDNTTKKIDFFTAPAKFGSNDHPICLEINLATLPWSPYKLKDFLQCKRRFYLKNILKLQKPQNKLYEVSKKEIGSIIHKVLELAYAHNNHFEKSETLFLLIKKHLKEFQKRYPQFLLDLVIWERKLYDFALFEINRFQSGATIYAKEKRFETTHHGVTINGIIDRIDAINHETYAIIDYKTSTSLTLGDPFDFQLEIYSLAMSHLKPKLFFYDLHNAKLLQKEEIESRIVELETILQSLHTSYVDFAKTDDFKHCRVCDFSTLCGRDS